MKIIIDCQALQTSSSRNRGIGRYSLDFLNEIIKIDLDVEIVLLTNAKLPTDYLDRIEFNGKKRIEIRRWSPLENSNWLNGNQTRRNLSEDIYLEVVKSLNADVYILLSPFEGLDEDAVWSVNSGTYNFVIYYDAIPRIYEKTYLGNKQIMGWYSTIESKIAKFDQILAISSSSATDAAKFLQIPESKISTIFFGIDTERSKTDQISNEEDDKFVLAVLGEDTRKNKQNLLIAWQKVHQQIPSATLKIVYKQSEPEKLSNRKILKDLNLSAAVEFLDFVTQEQLENLYSKCTFTVFPSFYEGLGLPILESYVFLKACLASETSSMNELVILPELKFDPNQPEDMANKIIGLFNNSELKLKAVNDGERIINKFSGLNKRNKLTQLLTSVEGKRIYKKTKDSDSRVHGVYFHTILKPTQSGVASFAENLIHPLHTLSNLVIVNDNPAISNHLCPTCGEPLTVISPSTFQDTYTDNYVNIHNIGNSIFHTWQVEFIGQYPGLLLMHDGYLSGLIWEWLRGNVDILEFLTFAIQETSAINFMDPLYFKQPHLLIQNEKLNEYFLESAHSIVVHNTQNEDMLRKDYFFEDHESINVIPLPIKRIKKEKADSRDSKIIGVFGIIAETKMFEEIIKSWKLSKAGQSKMYTLKFIGKNLSSDFDNLFKKNSKEFNIEHEGFVNEQEYWSQIESVKFAIQLRREIRGESSGAVVDLVSFGVPIISNMFMENEMTSFGSLNSISHEFTELELANKIDWVNDNIDIVVKKAVLARKQIEIEADPQKSAHGILQTALNGQSRSEYLPISQFKKFVSRYGDLVGKAVGINEIADICLESFPPVFKKIRIIVVLRELSPLESKKFKSVLHDLRFQLTEISHPPIFFCKISSANGHLETVNRMFFDDIYLEFLDSVDFRIRLQDSDIVFGIRNKASSLNADSSFGDLINSKLGDFLECTT